MSVIDTRGLSKVHEFSGKEEDFPKWNFWFLSYAALISPRMKQLMLWCDAQPECPKKADMVAYGDPDISRLSETLYHVLVQLCTKGKAVSVLMLQAETIEEGNGFLAYCNVKNTMQPRLGGRYAAMLGLLLNPEWNTQDLMKWKEAFTQWELAVARYETQTKKKVDDETRIAVILQYGPDEVKKLVLQNQRVINDDYSTMRGVVMDYILGGQDFPVNLKTATKKNENDMEVDMFHKKGHFGKYGKSKGKGDYYKGKGKGKDGQP